MANLIYQSLLEYFFTRRISKERRGLQKRHTALHGEGERGKNRNKKASYNLRTAP